jgi:hypothetical protein
MYVGQILTEADDIKFLGMPLHNQEEYKLFISKCWELGPSYRCVWKYSIGMDLVAACLNWPNRLETYCVAGYAVT